MPINEESPPPEAVDLARSALGTAMRREKPGAELLGGAVPEIEVAYRVFVTGLEDVRARRLIAGAKAVGWQFLVTAPATTVAAIEVPSDDSSQSVKTFNQVSRGPHIESLHSAVRRIGPRPDLVNGSLRLLRVPALYTLCLWLHGDNLDEFMPLPPTPRGIDAETPLSESALTDRLIVLAVERQAATALTEALQGGETKSVDRRRPKAP